MADTLATREGAVNRGFARVSWGAILAGALATIAFGIVLMSLGAAVGLTAFDPSRLFSGMISTTGGIISALWALLSIVVATFFGAWVASRASAVDNKGEAGLQGLFVWATSFLLMLAWASNVASEAAAGARAGLGAQAAGDLGMGAAWWFFLSAALAALAGVLGGTVGLPKSLKHGLEVRRRPLAPTETRA